MRRLNILFFLKGITPVCGFKETKRTPNHHFGPPGKAQLLLVGCCNQVLRPTPGPLGVSCAFRLQRRAGPSLARTPCQERLGEGKAGIPQPLLADSHQQTTRVCLRGYLGWFFTWLGHLGMPFFEGYLFWSWVPHETKRTPHHVGGPLTDTIRVWCPPLSFLGPPKVGVSMNASKSINF